MRTKKTYISLSILFFLSVLSYSQSNVISLKEFIETAPPKVGSNEWYPLNYSKNEFGVEIKNEKLEIKKVNEIHVRELNLPNGKLIGINKGEWGGKLSFIPTDKTKNEIEIKGGNIKFIFNFKGKIYFIEGLAHMGYVYGALFELDTTNDKFTYNKLIDFEDSPEAFTIYKDEILIAAHQNFYIVKDFKKELIFQNTFWDSLYPNSIAALNRKNVYIGMRGGIVKLNLDDKTFKFYKYNNLEKH